MNTSREELLISLLADMLAEDKHVAVGAASPIPGAAALLAKAEKAERGGRMQVTIIHSRRHNPFTEIRIRRAKNRYVPDKGRAKQHRLDLRREDIRPA